MPRGKVCLNEAEITDKSKETHCNELSIEFQCQNFNKYLEDERLIPVVSLLKNTITKFSKYIKADHDLQAERNYLLSLGYTPDEVDYIIEFDNDIVSEPKTTYRGFIMHRFTKIR